MPVNMVCVSKNNFNSIIAKPTNDKMIYDFKNKSCIIVEKSKFSTKREYEESDRLAYFLAGSFLLLVGFQLV